MLATFVGPRAEIDKLQDRIEDGRFTLEYYLTPPSRRLPKPKQYDVTIGPDLFPWLPGVSVTLVRGEDVIPVALVPMATKKMSVKLNLADPSLVDLAESKVDPPTVEVRGPKHIIAEYDEILTEPLSIRPPANGVEPTTSRPAAPAKLVAELQGQPVQCTPSAVRIQLRLNPLMRVEPITDVPVRFVCREGWPYQVRFLTERARTVTLLVRGPSQGAWPVDKIYVFVDLTPERYKPSLYADEPCVVYLPPGLLMAGDSPKVETFEIVPIKP